MNTSPFWPLVWKEYRVGRAFWLAMAVMGLVAQAAVAWAHQPTDRNWWLYGIALMISAGFAVGIGGTLFAIEHEDRTFGLLRVLPVRAKELGLAKLLCAVAGLCLLLVALWLTASALAGWQALSALDAGQLWGLWGLACAEGLAWGILCSLVIRSPLRATVAAVLAVTVANQFAVTLTKTHNLTEIVSYVEAIPYRLAVLMLVVAADVWLLPRWLTGQFPRVQQQTSPRRSAWAGRLRAQVRQWSESSPLVWRLVWQSWREGRKNIFLLVIVAPLLLLAQAAFFSGGPLLALPSLADLLPAALLILLAFVPLSALIGGLVFHADQLYGPRFLAERGISARMVWLARQLAWGSWLAVWAAAMLVLLPLAQLLLTWIRPSMSIGPFRPWALREFLETYHQWQTRNAWLLWEMVFSAYAAGQFASLLVRGRLLAGVFAIVLGSIVASWAWLMCALGIPVWWSVLPLPLAMLLATWLRAPDWMLERSNWRRWIVPITAVLLPAAAIAVAVPWFRANEIGPKLGSRWLNDRYAISTPSPEDVAEARQTFELDQQAWNLFRHAPQRPFDANGDQPKLTQQDEVWVKPIVDLVLESSRRPANLTALPLAQRLEMGQDPGLDQLLWEDARLHQEAGELDAALELYIGLLRRGTQLDVCRRNPSVSNSPVNRQILSALGNWSAASGQTGERIRAAIEQLKAWHAALPPAETLLLTAYETAEQPITDLPRAGNENLVPYAISEAEWLSRRLPWERARALRLLNYLASYQGCRVTNVTERFAENEPIRTWSLDRFDNPRAGSMLETTPLVQTSAFADPSFVWFVLCRETNHRATLIILALEAWKLEHGQLPDSLDDLAGSLLDVVPLDPRFAQPFLYYPAGVPAVPPPAASEPRPPAAGELLAQQRRGWQPGPINATALALNWVYPAFMSGRPFLWSALNQDQYAQPVDLRRDITAQWGYCREYGGQDNVAHPDPRFALDVLAAGHAYLVPQTGDEQP
ncbi:MAG TPA: ABC transporter permease [Pirellulales bacterium]|jgi:hypothetical protein|nr:ABC transporter permease [Pirellulales bacterium]